MSRRYTQIICRNFFKDGKGTTKEKFTKKWIETVNLLEKNNKAFSKKI